MTFEMPNLLPALPEMFLLTMTCVVLVVDLFTTDRTRGATYILAQASLVGTFIITLASWSEVAQLTFNGTFVRDSMGDLLKLFVYAGVFTVFVYSRDYLRARDIYKGEFFVLALFATLGMMVMISAHNFLTIYLGLELLSLCLYALVAIQRDSMRASESAMKYFVLGAIASGMLLYGMSMLYGVTGSLDLAEVNRGIAGQQRNMVAVFGMVFVIVGVAFKLGAVPFHMWVPDIYHGSPTATTLMIGTAPKLAAFAMLMRLLVDGMGTLQQDWTPILVILAVLSMAIGNIVAIAQSNIKRMLAYSTISHIGFLLLGVLTGTQSGYSASLFYVIVYMLMGLGGFGMIILMSRRGFEAENIEDFRGLNERSPWFAFMMLILMFSMAGVPPFLGFWAKLAVLAELVEVDLIWLAAVAVIFSIIGAYYYLRIVKQVYFDSCEESTPLEAAADMRVLLSINALGILVLGLFPGQLLALCQGIFPALASAS
ncbi:MAG TPA: NADH-quinone oxidoreductase subunit NuoN [Gammaproteobacteria bacterium]|nr:NADH-quinone oxidoreductase subunit NuoN [Gammaproteobacteria bacterium]